MMPPADDEEPRPRKEPSVLERIGSYVDRADHADVVGPEPQAADGRDLRSRHLLFVSSSAGYSLVEREGSPPAVGSRVDDAELDGSLVVMKVGSSPLPMDDRPCGFLERVD
jgi:hypothetical protein